MSTLVDSRESTARVSRIDMAMILVTVIWGVNFVVVKETLGEMRPLVFASIRLALAALFVVANLRWRNEDLRIEPRDVLPVLVTALVGNVAYQFLFIQGIARTSAGASTLLLATSPIFVTLLSALFRSDFITLPVAGGVALSFSGIVMVLGLGSGGLSGVGQSLLGNALTLGCAIAWASYTLMARPLLMRYSSVKLTAVCMVAASPILLLVALPDILAQDWSLVSLQGVGGLAYSFIFAIGLAYMIWNTSVQRVGNARTAVLSNLTPIVGLAASALILGETLNAWQILGAGVTLIGVTITRVARRPRIIQA